MRDCTLAVVVSIFIGMPASTLAAELSCSTETTLDALVTCIRNQMPGNGSNGFVIPNATQQNEWRWTVGQMMQGACDFVLPPSLAGIMQVRTFHDSGNGKDYCLLMEALDADNNGVVDRGWGTFLVDPHAERELSHQAPHPIFDSTTENEAVGVFRETNSRSYLLCGAHRNSNAQTSPCQSDYKVADCAHNVANMFQPTNAELMAYYGSAEWAAIQWHGMAAATCEAAEAYLTHGRNVSPVPADGIAELQSNIVALQPSWDVEVAGSGACSLHATTNVQGRLLNGVAPANVCGTAATSYSGRFIHNEQDPGFRDPADWAPAVAATWPVSTPGPPTPPSGLAAAGGDGTIDLTWAPSAGADGYNLYRGFASGGPYSNIASDLASTAHSDTGLANGATYYYVVTAENPNGESGYSNEAYATPSAPVVPDSPTGVTASPGKKKVTLRWDAVTGAGSYNVKSSTVSGGPYVAVASGITSTRYNHTGLDAGTTYHYVVSAVNANGEGANSAQVSATAK